MFLFILLKCFPAWPSPGLPVVSLNALTVSRGGWSESPAGDIRPRASEESHARHRPPPQLPAQWPGGGRGAACLERETPGRGGGGQTGEQGQAGQHQHHHSHPGVHLPPPHWEQGGLLELLLAAHNRECFSSKLRGLSVQGNGNMICAMSAFIFLEKNNKEQIYYILDSQY